MPNLLTMAIALAAVRFGAASIRKHRTLFAVLALGLSSTALLFPNLFFSPWLNDGYWGLTLWILVMFTGVRLPSRTLCKKLRLVRTPLSIAAFIFSAGHVIHDFVLLFDLPILTGFAALLVMTPLFVTSFEKMKKRMGCRRWKKLHRLAYPAYVFMLLHVMLVTGDLFHLVWYALVLGSYLVLRIRQGKKVPARLAAGGALVLTAALLAFHLPSAVFSEEETRAEIDPAQAAAPSALYRDGTYTGSADGFRPDLTLAVTIENGLMTAIEILSHNEVNASYYQAAFDAVPGEILASQSAAVDAVSGCTCTSYGIMNAVNDALSQALESGTLEAVETPEPAQSEGGGHHRKGRQVF